MVPTKKTLIILSTDVVDIIKHIGNPNGKQCLIVAYAHSTDPLYIISYIEGIKLIDIAIAKTEEDALKIAEALL